MEKDQLLPSAPTTGQPEQYNDYQVQQPPPPPPYQQVPPYPQYGYQYPPGPGYQYGAANNCNTTANIVVIQQPHIMRGTVLPPPSDYMALSIFACLCCCWPIGIIAIFKAAQSRTRYDEGDHVGAVESASMARRLSILAIVCGVVIVAVFIPLYVFLVAMSYEYQD